jgi:hypothetical protein
MHEPSVANLCELIRAEYLAIPRLQLTQAQVQHLWGVDVTTAGDLLETLVRERFVRVTPASAYVRVGDGVDTRRRLSEFRSGRRQAREGVRLVAGN